VPSYRNLCRSCEADFASVSAFERHRVGAHDLDYPEHENGRRCMDAEEMLEAGMELDQRGRWRLLFEKVIVSGSLNYEKLPRSSSAAHPRPVALGWPRLAPGPTEGETSSRTFVASD
jgi:hypothetical protein